MSTNMDFLLYLGKCDSGQFGTRIQSDSDVIGPTISNSKFSIKKIACGAAHTVFVTLDGLAYSAGNNDHGQLGRDGFRTRFEQISKLQEKFIVDVACGTHHTLLLDNTGFIYGFGSNCYGQLRLSSEFQNSPFPKYKIFYTGALIIFQELYILLRAIQRLLL